jgi:RNA polymerase sigma-70 factor (ECF subfamily)
MSKSNHAITYLDSSKDPPATTVSPNGVIDDVALMRMAREDKSCFAQLYDRYFDSIYAYCLKRVSTLEEAEDLTSLTFMQALSDLPQYRGGSVAAWLFRIARNRVIDHYRQRRAQVSLDTIEFSMTAAHPVPLDMLTQAEDYRIIRDLVADLPDGHRDILALKINGGLTAEEIGALVGRTAGAVRVMLHRTIKRLRARYEETLKQEGSS